MANDVVEGVFAIHKPPSISSAQVIRDVQAHFKNSDLFAPWLKQEKDRLQEARRHQRKARFRKDRNALEVKIGHGGTLDPMATGVLILGVGSGTKRLSEFLSCTKSYETVVLFGQATDTYDVSGKTLASMDYQHITKEQVERALAKYRGSIMQRPPIYSALRIDGKRLYEYAREGKQVPKEIQERPVTVQELELIEWLPGGSHPYHWPTLQADEGEKEVVAELLDLGEQSATTITSETASDGTLKREREEHDINHASSGPSKKAKSGANTGLDEKEHTSELHQQSAKGPPTSTPPCPAPACRLRMTVTSGFYVRSLCNDLGIAVDSLGAMADLVRTRQGDFVLGENVFEYQDLEQGEETWSPTIKQMLEVSRTTNANASP